MNVDRRFLIWALVYAGVGMALVWGCTWRRHGITSSYYYAGAGFLMLVGASILMWFPQLVPAFL
jgi:hypothetical protein